MYFIDVAVLVGLVLIQIETERPFVSAAIYGGVVTAFAVVSVFSGLIGIAGACLGALLNVAVGTAFFWLLDRIETLSLPWWTVLLGGVLVLVFVV